MAKKNKEWLVIFLLFFNVLAWLVVWQDFQPKHFSVIFLDVGQGDAILIENWQGHQILIDGGPDLKILEKLASYLPFYDRSLDLIILSHPEKDHLLGLIEVLKRYQIENILWTGVKRSTVEYQAWENALELEGARVRIAKAGQTIKVGQGLLKVLYPVESLEGQEYEDSNDTSLVARLDFGQTSFLFPGDLYQSGEQRLIEEKSNIDSDVLKVAHHGSKTSSSLEFLEKSSPQIAVISLAKNNSYGHPHQEVIERLEQENILILRTDQMGDIRIETDGQQLFLRQ